MKAHSRLSIDWFDLRQMIGDGAKVRRHWSLNPLRAADDRLAADQQTPDMIVYCYPPRWLHWLALEALKLWHMLRR